MRSAAGRIDALSYWVVSDQFEELGRPPRLLHGGFGLRTVGELRKPRWWALWLLEQLGSDEVAATLTGDGADSLVEAWASRDGDDDVSRVAVALWNGTLDQGKVDGSAALDRTVHLVLDGLPPGSWTVRESRVDADHSNIAALWSSMSDGRRLADRRPVGDPARGRPAGRDRAAAGRLLDRRRPAQPVDRPGRAGSRVSSWWRSAVVYQVYVRSFLDGDGDGVGDLAGLTAGLDAVARLGVDAPLAHAGVPLPAGRPRVRRGRPPRHRPAVRGPRRVRRVRRRPRTTAACGW